MEFLKGVFGEEKLSFSELESKLKDNKDIKLVNLAKGGYVDKDKFTRMQEKLKEVEDLNSGFVEKLGKFDEIKQELATIKTEKANIIQSDLLTKANAKSEFVDFIRYNLKASDKEFAEALSEYKESNPQFFNEETKQENKTIISSGFSLSGGKEKKTASQEFNDMILRSFRK